MPEVADARATAVEEGRRSPAKAAGLLLFLPAVLELDLPSAITQAGLPGSEQIPPLQAPLAAPAPELLGRRRVSHISDLCRDEGAGPFAGLNVLPRVTYASDYSDKTERAMTERVIAKTPPGEPPIALRPRLPLRPVPR